MIERREGFSGESRRGSLTRRLEAVGVIRRGTYTKQAQQRRDEAARLVAIDRHQHGQDAA